MITRGSAAPAPPPARAQTHANNTDINVNKIVTHT